jgi:AcrR family transcriptional regulator
VPTSLELAAPHTASRRADGKARVRAGLLSAARELFARQGVAATTMDDIARLAAVSRATAFNYFPSKHLLLAALVREMEARFLHIMDTQFDQPASAAARIAALFSWTAAKVEETPQLSRVLIGASETTFGAASDSGARTARTHRAFTRVLDAGRRDGDVRRDVPTEVLAEIVGGSYAGILHAWRVARRYPLRRRLDVAALALGELISATPRLARRQGGAR